MWFPPPNVIVPWFPSSGTSTFPQKGFYCQRHGHGQRLDSSFVSIFLPPPLSTSPLSVFQQLPWLFASKRVLNLPPSPEHPAQTNKTPTTGGNHIQPNQTTAEDASLIPPGSPERLQPQILRAYIHLLTTPQHASQHQYLLLLFAVLPLLTPPHPHLPTTLPFSYPLSTP